MVVSEELSKRVGIEVASDAWRDVHAELVEYVKHVLAGLRTSNVVLGMGLGLPTEAVSELRHGRATGLRVDELMTVLEKLELAITLDAQPDGRIGVAFGAPELRLT
ncbi:MAG: hypothetical protein Q8L14_01615 [Myxococcales bacterium]|nr:hypothetical protein [Myxococcales bacterium]